MQYRMCLIPWFVLLVVYSWLAIVDDTTIATIDHTNDLITAAFAADLTLHHVLHMPCMTNGVWFSPTTETILRGRSLPPYPGPSQMSPRTVTLDYNLK